MAVCRLCKTDIPEGEEYCKKCFESNRARMGESYLDSLLKSVTDTHKNRTFQSKKVLQDVDSDFANTSNNNDLSEKQDEVLLNRYNTQNITKQDEKILRDEFDKENELNNSTDDDILSLLEDDPEEEKKKDNSEAPLKEAGYDNDDIPEMEDTDEDLLALLDMISAQDEANVNKKNNIPSENMEDPPVRSEPEEEQPVTDDILSIEDLPSEISDGYEEETIKEEKPAGASDMGGIFSDVLSAVDTLDDKEEAGRELKDPAVSGNSSSLNTEEKTQDKKRGFWKKLFGKKEDNQADKANSDVDFQPAYKAADQIKAENNKAENKKTEKKKAEKKQAEEIKAEKAKKKAEAKKNARKPKQSKAADSNGEENKSVTDKKAKAKTKTKKEAKKKQAKKTSPKKVKKVSAVKEAVAAEDSDDNIKINKLVIIFVMTFFILVGGFVILGTDMYSYSLNIQNANVDFSRRRYTDAYNQIYGLDIRKKDSDTYEKIMTVMFVDKELNSYHNYMDIKMYPEALDSLLKGIERYDKYIKRATKLGIKTDMNYVKKQILAELKQEFNISEEEAVALNNSENQTQYSINVINTVLEKRK